MNGGGYTLVTWALKLLELPSNLHRRTCGVMSLGRQVRLFQLRCKPGLGCWCNPGTLPDQSKAEFGRL